MAKVCISDGLTTDADGKLIVNTSGGAFALAYVGCDEANAGQVYFAPSGKIVLAPEKFNIHEFTTLSLPDRNLNGYNNADDAVREVKTSVTTGSVISTNLVIANPSDCRAMKLTVKAGVNHASFGKFGNGNTSVLYGARVVASGDFSDTHDFGHQSWRHYGGSAGDQLKLDSAGATFVKAYTLSAGGSVTFNLRAITQLGAYNGNSNLVNWSNILEVFGISV